MLSSTVGAVAGALKVATPYLTSVATLAQFLNEAEQAGGEVVENLSSRTNLSLPNYIKRCAILHRVFVQRELASEEEIMRDVLTTTQNMVAAWVLCALQLNVRVDGIRTTRRLLDVVATESFGESNPIVSTLQKFAEKYPGNLYGKEVYSDIKTESEMVYPGLEIMTDYSLEDKTLPAKYEPKEENPYADMTGHTTGAREIEIQSKLSLPSGKILNIDFAGPNGTKASVSTWLQLIPLLIPENVMDQFVSLNFKSLDRRWIQLTTGEISFLKDFIAYADQRKALRKALKDDKSGALQSMLDAKNRSVAKAGMKFSGMRPTQQNIANSILVYDKPSFDRICKKYNCKFNMPNHRAKFFDGTMAMMVIVVDSMTGFVTFYMNGLDAVAEYSTAQLKSRASSDKFSIMDIMQAMSRNAAPKF